MNEQIKAGRSGLVIRFPNYNTMFLQALVLFLCAEPIQYLLGIIGLNGSVQMITSLVIVYAPLIFGFLQRRSLKWGFITLIIGITAILLYTIIVYPEYRNVLVGDTYYYSFKNQVIAPFGSIFGFLFAENIEDFKTIKKGFLISAIVLFVFYSIQAVQSGGVWVVANTGRIAYYSMSFSYGILFPILTLFTYGFEHKKIIPISIAVAGVFEIIVYGSRGALVVLMLYLIIYMVWAWNPKRKQTKWILVSLASIMLVIFFISENFQEGLISALINRTSSLGYNSRLLSVLSSRSILSEDRITSLWPATLNLIKKNILIGNGLYSNHYWNGGFAHNIILEILVDFGIIFGGLLLIFLGKTINQVFKRSIYEEERFVFVILISFFVGRLMFSSSFWYEKIFWIYIACYFKLRKCNSNAEL